MSNSFDITNLFNNLKNNTISIANMTVPFDINNENVFSEKSTTYGDDNSISSSDYNLLEDVEEKEDNSISNKEYNYFEELDKTYNEEGNISQRLLSYDEDNDGVSDCSLIVNYAYDKEGNITGQEIAFDEDNDGKTDSNITISYEFDENGNITAQTLNQDDDNDGSVDKTLTLAYEYEEEENTEFEFYSDIAETTLNKIQYDENNEPYIIRESYSQDSSNDHLDTLGKIVSNIYGVDFYSEEGQAIFEALAEKNPEAIDKNNPDTILIDKIYLIDPATIEDGAEENKTTSLASMTAELTESEEDKKGNKLTKTTTDDYESDGENLNLTKELMIERRKSGAVVDIECTDNTLKNGAITSDIDPIENIIVKTDNYTVSLGNKINGKVSGCQQGAGGNCYLLAAVNALSTSETGQEIIKNAIDRQDGYTIVHLKDTDIYVTDSEVAVGRNLDGTSNGDFDMTVLELAFEKYLKEKKGITDETFYTWASLNGGHPSEILEQLSGAKGYWSYDKDKMEELLDEFMESEENISLVAGTYDDARTGAVRNYLHSGSTKGLNLISNHAYTIVGVDEDYVTLTNPWDSSVEIKITRDEFLENFQVLRWIELS